MTNEQAPEIEEKEISQEAPTVMVSVPPIRPGEENFEQDETEIGRVHVDADAVGGFGDRTIVLPHVDSEEGPGLEKAAPVSLSRTHLKSVMESLIFVSDKPLSERELAKMVRARGPELRPLLSELQAEYHGRGIELVEVSGGFQFRTAAANSPFVRDYVAQKPVRLSRAQLETLSIIAYRQPVTRPEVDEIRGVDSGATLKLLLERGLVKILGKKEEAGRPMIYGTTPVFLEFFGLNSLRDLPTLREFTDLSDESRNIFERKMGEPLGDINAAAASGSADAHAEAVAEEAAAQAVRDAVVQPDLDWSSDETVVGESRDAELTTHNADDDE